MAQRVAGVYGPRARASDRLHSWALPRVERARARRRVRRMLAERATGIATGARL